MEGVERGKFLTSVLESSCFISLFGGIFTIAVEDEKIYEFLEISMIAIGKTQ
jgi:hypothetical protein